MARIFVFGLFAAVYPQLLAVVVVILTRPSPKPLLWACYLASLVVSVGCSAAILAVFRSRGSVVGTSSQSVGPAAYLIVGGIALWRSRASHRLRAGASCWARICRGDADVITTTRTNRDPSDA